MQHLFYCEYNVSILMFRKVQNESATGSSTSNRVRTTLTITVETIDFDTQACMLRLKGRNIEENQYVKVSKFSIMNYPQITLKYTSGYSSM